MPGQQISNDFAGNLRFDGPELTNAPEKALTRRTSFGELIALARAGDQDAATQIVERYGKHVRRAVRRMLPNRLRSLYDSDDFGQAVWKSFFADRPEIDEFTGPAQLIAYLAALARNKVIDESRRRLGTKKHDLGRVQSASWDSALAPVDTRNPSPSEVAIADEELNRLSGSAAGEMRSILQLRIAGCSSREIAAITGLHERAVRREIQRLATTIER